MNINQSQVNDVFILELDGKLDIMNQDELENSFNSLIDAGNLNIIMDCQKLTFISSAGLRLLIIIWKKMEPLKGKLAVCSLNENTKKIFDISGYSQIFTIFSNKEEALKFF